MTRIRRPCPSRVFLNPPSCRTSPLYLNRALQGRRSYSSVQTSFPLPVKKPTPRGTCQTAIIGSGPAGFYTAERILKHLPEARVDMYESLPVPYGLVRYGVAPDHPEVKKVQHGFEEMCLSGKLRFLGNVPVGTEGGVGVDVLSRYYDAIIFAYGAAKTKKLGIEGEELQGVHSAGDFVGWYNGLPSHKDMKFHLDVEDAVIIGHGNVALDVARMLLTPPELLAKTDITKHALQILHENRIKTVTIAGRRGIIQSAFTVKELRELTVIPGTDFTPVIDETELQLPDGNSLRRVPKRKMQIFTTEMNKQIQNTDRTESFEQHCRMLFLVSPTQFLGRDNRVNQVVLTRNRLLEPANEDSKVVSANSTMTIPAQIVFTAIGYTSVLLAGMSDLKVDVVRGVIPNNKGRVETVVTKDFGYVESEAAMRERVPGMYVSGWVKTGPTGVIATTMYSAFETGDSLVQDWNEGKPFLEPDAEVKGWEGFKKEVEKVGGKPVEWKDWKIIEAEENRRGQEREKPREKIVDIQEMIDLVENA